MRVDVISIFPDYLAALDLSLVGKARQRGLLDLRVHDLRDWTADRHRTVDDTPFGGGAGMVMRPDIWGLAIDEVLDTGATGAHLIVPTPSGEVFTQRHAESLASAEQLVFACGRYEGIDARVAQHYRDAGITVHELSIGDYVLNGGEVAVARHDRGRGAADPRHGRQPGLPGGGVARGRGAAGVPGLHEAAVVGGPRDPRGARCRGTTRRSSAGAGTARWSGRRGCDRT